MTNLAGNFVLDPAHTTIGFVARYAMVTKVRGNFTAFRTRLTLCLEPGVQQRNAHYGHTVKRKFQPTSHATNPTRPAPTA